MRLARIAVRATVLASSIRINPCPEGNVGAVIVRDYSLRQITKKLSSGRGIICGIPIRVTFQLQRLKAIGQVRAGAPGAMSRSTPLFYVAVHRLSSLTHGSRDGILPLRSGTNVSRRHS